MSESEKPSERAARALLTSKFFWDIAISLVRVATETGQPGDSGPLYPFVALMIDQQTSCDTLSKERDDAIRERDACHQCWDDFRAKVEPVIPALKNAPLFQQADSIVALAQENERLRDGENWARGIFVEIMATAISGYADAAIVAQQEMGPEHSLKAVQQCAQFAKQMRNEKEDAIALLRRCLSPVQLSAEEAPMRQTRDSHTALECDIQSFLVRVNEGKS